MSSAARHKIILHFRRVLQSVFVCVGYFNCYASTQINRYIVRWTLTRHLARNGFFIYTLCVCVQTAAALLVQLLLSHSLRALEDRGVRKNGVFFCRRAALLSLPFKSLAAL
jgi:hypothetical protein